MHTRNYGVSSVEMFITGQDDYSMERHLSQTPSLKQHSPRSKRLMDQESMWTTIQLHADAWSQDTVYFSSGIAAQEFI
jgi:hypothetical protein